MPRIRLRATDNEAVENEGCEFEVEKKLFCIYSTTSADELPSQERGCAAEVLVADSEWDGRFRGPTRVHG